MPGGAAIHNAAISDIFASCSPVSRGVIAESLKNAMPKVINVASPTKTPTRSIFQLGILRYSEGIARSFQRISYYRRTKYYLKPSRNENRIARVSKTDQKLELPRVGLM